MSEKSENTSTLNSLVLQNYIKHSLDTLKLKGYTPKGAAEIMLGVGVNCGEDKPDWIDVEYLVYWHLKLILNEETANV